jgi:hypothetical protein
MAGQMAGAVRQVLPAALLQDAPTSLFHRRQNMSTGRKGLQFSFVLHAIVYALVIGGLWRLNQTTNSQFDWASIVAWGWGIGLAAHGAVWFMYGRGPGSDTKRVTR